MLWASIPDEFEAMGFKPVKYKDSEEELAFHYPPYTSKTTSKPGTSAVRGGKKYMYYDEAAHIKEFPKLWQAGLPAITRGEGRVTVISTPLGESGLYHDLWKEKRFSRHEVPWWESRFMVKGAEYSSDPYAVVAEACEKAPLMDTETRLKAFASDKLQDIFEVGMRGDLISFKTEYECTFVDETDSYYPYELVLEGVDDELKVWKRWYDGFEPEGTISIGVDLAKKRDETVFTVVEHVGDVKYVRLIMATQADYEDQFEQLKKLVKQTNARRVTIDESGVGEPFMEKARAGRLETSANVEGITFSQDNKEKWATTFKGDLQTEGPSGHSRIHYPRVVKLMDQIHGIKRTRTENGFFKFSGEHDDYFWSLMLALYGVGRAPVTFHRIG